MRNASWTSIRWTGYVDHPGSTFGHTSVSHVRAIIEHAARDVSDEEGEAHPSPRLHRAEQLFLLARLAADSGARRGELAAIQLDDLDGDVLTISKSASGEVIGPTRVWPNSSSHPRCDDGRSVAAVREALAEPRWRSTSIRTVAVLRLSRPRNQADHIVPRALVPELCTEAGHSEITLHRLRHTVATTLVSQGNILQAQYRLGHRDASTTLRIYSHVLPLTDSDAAATFDKLYKL